MNWREEHLPDLPWAPRGLPGLMRSVPGWVARSAVEARFGLEIADFLASVARGSENLTGGVAGRGYPVLVIPGFGFGDSATLPLQLALSAAGYEVAMSKILVNIDCSDATVDRLVDVAEEVQEQYGVPPHVVGHSRGGMLARGLAVRRPDLVRRVIAMGSPLNYEFAFYEIPQPLVAALQVVHQIDGDRRELRCATPECRCPYMTAAHRPLPHDVDLVSLYSTSDGIVDWRACVVPGAVNIRVPGTHLGMGLKPATLREILAQLAQATPAEWAAAVGSD